jgi:hypothetical protein
MKSNGRDGMGQDVKGCEEVERKGMRRDRRRRIERYVRKGIIEKG